MEDMQVRHNLRDRVSEFSRRKITKFVLAVDRCIYVYGVIFQIGRTSVGRLADF